MSGEQKTNFVESSGIFFFDTPLIKSNNLLGCYNCFQNKSITAHLQNKTITLQQYILWQTRPSENVFLVHSEAVIEWFMLKSHSKHLLTYFQSVPGVLLFMIFKLHFF